MDVVEKLRSYKRDRSGYAEYCHQAADEIERLRMALHDAGVGFDLAYGALEKGCYDEAMLHCGHHHAQTAKAMRPNVELRGAEPASSAERPESEANGVNRRGSQQRIDGG